MLGGERRWAPASTRRSGMTVLGKVVVPKPYNLPSQRSENHGLDPRVEIVPKGTHSWGSRSSSTSNAWSSSVLSPRNDGRPGSPSYLSGRPSSGGSGTRPSTASSDRAHEPTVSAWGPNSRPSSASGALTSNQTSLTSLRPRSAETRPGSSQLSRFAESLPENPGAWGAAGTAEKLGVTAAKNDGFSLTSGDFPTLGSEKDNSGKNESQDHGSHDCPGSSSGEVGPPKERNGTSRVGDVSVNVDVKIGTANSWRRDSPPYSEDGVASSVERWQGNPQPYPNPSIPPQHYEAWHGPPVTNPPSGVWFRGPPGGPPYGAPVGPGGFPIEPYSYYRPHIPPALANPQPGPPPGGRPRGHHPKNGDMYRPHMPDAYIRPGMPIRPGFYPGPVAYEGYYGGPMSYCSSNERDVPFMGMTPGTSVYNNRYPSQNAPEPGNSQGRSGGYSSTGKTLVSEHVESGHPNDNQGPYKVLLKQQNGWDGKNEEKKWEDTTTTNATYVEKGDQPEMSSWENDWRSDYRNNGEMGLRRMAPGQEISSQTYDDQQSYSSVPVVKSPESTGNMKAFDDSSARNLERASSGLSEVRGPVSAVPKDSTLIRKIEGLNAKVRASDGQDITSITGWEEQKNKIHVHNTKANHSKNDGGSGFVHTERTHATGIMNPASHEMGVSARDKSLESTAAGGTTISRRSTHGMQGRSGNHGKGGINSKEADGRHKKIHAIDSPSVVSTSRIQTNSNVHVHDRHTSEASEKSGLYPQAREEKESAPPVCDPSDFQRTKLRELEQRAKQLREEEEERTRKQKAKALAKLEELNRKQSTEGSMHKSENASCEEEERTRKQKAKALAKLEELNRKQSTEGSMHKSENASCVAIQNKQELNVVPRISEGNTSRDEQSPVLFNELPPEKPKSTNEEPILHKHSVSLQQDADSADVAYRTNAPHVHDGNASKHKYMGYKQKKNLQSEKSSNGKSTFTSTNEAPNSEVDAVRKVAVSIGGFNNEIALNCKSSLSVNENAVVESTRLPVDVNSVAESSSFPVNPNAVAESSSMPVNSNAGADSSMHQRKKSRSSKNKHKVEAASSMAVLPLSESKETDLVNASLESGRPKTSETELDPNLIQSVTISEDANQLLEHHSSLSSEDSHGRGSNSQWKSQHSRRMARNPQVNRSAEKFHGDVIWAPVRSQNKADTDEASQKIVDEAITPSMRSEHQVQSNPKNKRAEIERYVPKPVAKEMAQQGSIQQPVASSINQTTYDETVGRADSSPQGTESTEPAGLGAGKVGPALEPRNGDGKQNKQGKAHGSWRQRGSTESVSVQSMHDGPSSHPGRNAKKLIEDYQPQKPDVSSVKEQPKYSDEQNAPDGQKAPDNSDSVASVAVTAVKDQVVTGRVKRQPFKGQKGMGHNNDLDHKRINSADTSKINTQSSALEMSQTDLPTALKETRGIGERSMAHWQPKSQSFSANNQQGSKSNSGRSVGAGAVWTNKKENTPQGVVPQEPQHSEGVSQPRNDQSPSEKSDAEEAVNVGYQEATRGRKVGSFKGRPLSPSQLPVGPVEHAPASVDARHEQRSSSGFRRSANQNNNRFDRGHESRGDWNSSGQESRHHHAPGNWERQRHNAHHYEYQPVGPYNNNKSNNVEGLKDGTHNTGPRFRERGQNQSRRGGGNFYGRQRSNDRVDGGYE